MPGALKNLATELCRGRLVFTLEGGYNLRVIASSIKAIFDVLLGNSEIEDPMGEAEVRKAEGFDEHIETIKRIHHIR
jgi:acetoin utilization deacetylase AcuC-like enzyme